MQTDGDAEGDLANDPGAEAITALEYSSNGDYLATGDRNGRITVLKLDTESKLQHNQECWLPHFQFQSHEPEFDFLKSLEIEGKINQIKFCNPTESSNFILSANDKTIKLWKIGAQKRFIPRCADNFMSRRQISLPVLDESLPVIDSLQAIAKRIYANAHAYHINSLALCTDNESFFSADDLRVNWWRIDSSDTAFNLIDIKPENMEELTEVITALQCHPQQCNTLVYSSSRGAIKMCDTRSAALCTTYPKVYADQSVTAASKSFITDILNSISDITYSSDGRFIIARDYLTIKIWDVNMERRPVKTVALHDYLRPMLYDLYTSDIIFDKFEVACSSDGKSIATGSYSNQLKIFHQDGRGLRNVDLPQSIIEGEPLSPNIAVETGVNELGKSVDKMKLRETSRGSGGGGGGVIGGGGRGGGSQQQEVKLDEKVLHCSWHPTSNTIAVAGKVGLCLYKV